jgi:hypothetical protein
MTTQTLILVQISNGTVNLPMWIMTGSGNFVRYSGNDTVSFNVGPFNSVTPQSEMPIATIHFESVTFSNGNATKSWNDGRVMFEDD